VFEIKNQEFPAPLKLKAELPSGTLVYPTIKRELRYFPNYKSEYLKPQNLTRLLAALPQCQQSPYTKSWTERNTHV